MKRFFQETNEPLGDSIFDEKELNLQIYEHLNSVIKLDMNGNLVSYNQAFAKQYGYNVNDFTKPFLDVFINYDTHEQKGIFNKSILGETQRFDAIGRCKNGKMVTINVTLLPIETKDGLDIFVVVKDTADSKNQEKEKLLFKQTQKVMNVFNEFENICNFYYDAINDHHTYSKQLPIIFGINEDQIFHQHLSNYYNIYILTIVL